MIKKLSKFLGLILCLTLVFGFMHISNNEVYAQNHERGGLKKWLEESKPINGGYYRVWNDFKAENAVLHKNAQTKMGDIPKEVNLVLAFYDNEMARISKEDMKEYVSQLHAKGQKVVGSIFVHLLYDPIHYHLSLHDELQKKYPDDVQYDYQAQRYLLKFEKSKEGNKRRSEFIRHYYMDMYDFDGLDIDMEKSASEVEKHMPQIKEMFEELSTYIGPKNNSNKLFIYDTTYDAEHPIFQQNKDLFDLILLQLYGYPSEFRLVNKHKSLFESFSKYVPMENILIGFSFYEENTHASRGYNPHTNRWYDTPMSNGLVEYLTQQEYKGEYRLGELKDSRAGRYAKWQDEFGLKGGIFSYAVDRDGVPHPTREDAENMFREYSKFSLGGGYDIEAWVRAGRPGKSPQDDLQATDYSQSVELYKLMVEDGDYGLIDETDFPDEALLETVKKHVGIYRGNIKRYNKELYIDNSEIRDLTGLEKFENVSKITLYGLDKITKLTKENLPKSLQNPDKEVFNKPFDTKLVISGLTSLENLDLSQLNLETLEIREPENFTSLKKVNVSNNRLDLSKYSYDREILEKFNEIIRKNLQKEGIEFTNENLKFGNQKPRAYYPNFEPKYIKLSIGDENFEPKQILKGQKTIKGMFIENEDSFNEFLNDTLFGEKYNSDELVYDDFKIDYENVSITLSDIDGNRVNEKTVKTDKEGIFVVSYKNFDLESKNKEIHKVKVTVGEGATSSKNLAYKAYLFGDYTQTLDRIFDEGEQYTQSFLTWGPGTQEVYFRIPEEAIVENIEIVSNKLKDVKLEYLEKDKYTSKNEKLDDIKKEEGWKVAYNSNELEGKKSHKLDQSINSSYWKITFTHEGRDSLKELRLFGYKKSEKSLNEKKIEAYKDIDALGLRSKFIEKIIEESKNPESLESLIKMLRDNKLQALLSLVENLESIDLTQNESDKLIEKLEDSLNNANEIIEKNRVTKEEIEDAENKVFDVIKELYKEKIINLEYISEEEKDDFNNQVDSISKKDIDVLIQLYKKVDDLNKSKKPLEIFEDVNFETVYVADDKLEFGEKETESEGKKGKLKIVYQNGEQILVETIEESEPKVIKVGNVNIEQTKVPFNIERKYVSSRLAKEGDVTVVEGEEGIDTTKTVYKVNPKDGSLYEPDVTVERTKPVVNKKVEYGNAVEFTPIEDNAITTKVEIVPFETKYVADSNLKFGEMKEVVEGINGEVVIKIQNGEEISRETIKDKTDRVLNIGNVEIINSEVPFGTNIVDDSDKYIFEDEIVEDGKLGLDEVKKVYEVNQETGELINPQTSVIRLVQPINKKIIKGIKLADNTELKSKYEELNKINKKYLTSESLEKLESLIKTVKDAIDNKKITPKEIDLVIKEINKVSNELDRKTGVIKFNLSGGILNNSKEDLVLEAKLGDEIEIPAAPIKEGFKFSYWKGSTYYPGDKYLVEGDHDFTAIWELAQNNDNIGNKNDSNDKNITEDKKDDNKSNSQGDASRTDVGNSLNGKTKPNTDKNSTSDKNIRNDENTGKNINSNRSKENNNILKNTNRSINVKTGDNTSIIVLIALLVVSAGLYIFISKKKNK